MFKAAKLSQDLCNVWILSVMHTASNNWEKSSHFDVDTQLLSYCMDINVLSQMEGAYTLSG